MFFILSVKIVSSRHGSLFPPDLLKNRIPSLDPEADYAEELKLGLRPQTVMKKSRGKGELAGIDNEVGYRQE